jgi:hypothetical protein
MRRRTIPAAIAALAAALGAVLPARAESPAATSSSRAQAIAGTEGFSLLGGAPALGGEAGFFASASPTASMSGHYTHIPTLGPLSSAQSFADTVSLRDLAVSARIVPGLEADFARWSTPPSEAFASQGAYSSPLASAPFGLASAGSYAGATLLLGSNLRVHLGHSSASLGPALDSGSALERGLAARLGSLGEAENNRATLQFDVQDWAQLGFTASRTRETGALLDSIAPGAAATLSGAETTAFGVSARVGFGEGWVTTVAFNEGVSQLNLDRNGVGFQPLRSQSYGVAVAKQGLFGNDALGIAVSRPLQTYGTNFASALLPGASPAAPPANWSAPGTVAESDFQVGYVTTFLDGALALQANAAYQMNANGDKGQDAVSVLSRAKIKF